MTHQIILLVLVAFLFVLPFIYKKAGRRWTRFYLNMAMSEQHRKTFILVMAILILSVNFLQYRIYGPRLWLIPGFVAGLLALKYKWTDAVMRWIHKDRMLQFFALALSLRWQSQTTELFCRCPTRKSGISTSKAIVPVIAWHSATHKCHRSTGNNSI